MTKTQEATEQVLDTLTDTGCDWNPDSMEDFARWVVEVYGPKAASLDEGELWDLRADWWNAVAF